MSCLFRRSFSGRAPQSGWDADGDHAGVRNWVVWWAIVSRTSPNGVDSACSEEAMLPVGRGVCALDDNCGIIGSNRHGTATITRLTALAGRRAFLSSVEGDGFADALLFLGVFFGVSEDLALGAIEEFVGIRVEVVPPAPLFVRGDGGWACVDDDGSVFFGKEGATHDEGEGEWAKTGPVR